MWLQGLTAWHGLCELGRLDRAVADAEEDEEAAAAEAAAEAAASAADASAAPEAAVLPSASAAVTTAAAARPTVLVYSAAGGVGLHALEIAANYLGCDCAAVVGSDAKAALLRARFPDPDEGEGAGNSVSSSGSARVRRRGKVTPVVRRAQPDDAWRAALDEFLSSSSSSGGFAVALDSLGGLWLGDALARVAPRGTLMHFGATAAYGSATSGPLKWLGLAAAYLRRPTIDPGALTSTNRAVVRHTKKKGAHGAPLIFYLVGCVFDTERCTLPFR